MKKWLKRILITAAVLTFACGAWLLGYRTHKNPDNIPTKELMLSYWTDQGERYALSRIEGYTRDVLTMIWQEPEGSLFGFYGDIWTTDTGELIVYYDKNSRVTDLRCRFLEADPIVSQNTYNGTITGILTESEDASVLDNVLEVKTNRGEILYFTLAEESRITGTLTIGSEVSITCEEYSHTGYLPIIDITAP